MSPVEIVLLRVGKGRGGCDGNQLVSSYAARKNLVGAARGIEIPSAFRRLQQRNREGKILSSDVEHFSFAFDLAPAIHRLVCQDELGEGVFVLDRIARKQDVGHVWTEDRGQDRKRVV